jgi:simple sugar transport system substrate-binding protein
MTRLRHHPILAVLVATLLLAAAACSSSGGKKAEENTATASAGKANTPNMTFAMVTHGAPSDTFWDIIRKGAQAAAAKDNVTLKYSSDPDSGKQATLIQSAIDSKVDGIAITLPDPPAIAPAVKKAIAAGIPVVAFNAGINQYQQTGALAYFGS